MIDGLEFSLEVRWTGSLTFIRIFQLPFDIERDRRTATLNKCVSKGAVTLRYLAYDHGERLEHVTTPCTQEKQDILEPIDAPYPGGRRHP